MLKILHLAPDEKFIDRGLSFFNEDPRVINSLLVVSASHSTKFVLTKANYRCTPEQQHEICEIAANYDVLVLHSLSNYFFKAVQENTEKFIFWIGMGYDYYDLMHYTQYHLMMEKTKKFYMNEISSLRYEDIEHQIITSKAPTEKLALMEYINLFAPVLETEHKMLGARVQTLPTYHQWNYIYEDLGSFNDENVFLTSNSLFIGNSADPSNNHLDVLEQLKSFQLSSDAQIITPLSYGNTKYAQKIAEQYTEHFKEKYLPVTEYMTLSDYGHLLRKASTAIMAHKRQQALGNIIMMLMLGYKIYLNKESPCFDFLKLNGIKVFELDDLAEATLTLPLTHEERVSNKTIIKKLFSAKTNREKTKELIELMLEFQESK